MDYAELWWMCNQLNNKKQRVTINGLSEWKEVSSGVPQESVLGPLQFNMFMNDLDSGGESFLIKIADGTKLGTVAYALEDRSKIKMNFDKLDS